MLDHITASRIFATRKRPDPHIGIKLRTNFWLRRYPESSDFEVILVYPTYEEGTRKKKPKQFWGVHHAAIITQNHVQISSHGILSSTAMRALWGIAVRGPKSNEIEGLEFYSNTGASIVTPYPVRYSTMTKSFERIVPKRVRHTDPEKKKELDTLVREARRKFRTRAKLGIFRTMAPEDLAELRYNRVKQEFCDMDNPEVLYMTLKAVSEDGDIQSFAMLYQMLYGGSAFYMRKALENYDVDSLIALFDRKITNARNKLNEFYGAKYYA